MSRAKATKTRPKLHLQINLSNKTHKRTPHSHKNLTSNQKQHTQKQERNCDKIIVVLSEKTQVKLKNPQLRFFKYAMSMFYSSFVTSTAELQTNNYKRN